MSSRKKTGDGRRGESVFAGLVFCVSGQFRVSQSEMKSLISEHGGPTRHTRMPHALAS
jgi:hypothetical protein